MKPVLFALPLMLAASSAFAAGLTVTNHTGMPIDELFVSPPGKSQFGANLMEGVKEGALDNGKTVTVAAVAPGTYDVQLSAPDEGVLCVIPNVKVKGPKIELTAKQGKACK